MGRAVWRSAARSLAVLAALLAAHAARASDPLQGDAVAPPPDKNIILYYNLFGGSTVIEPPHGQGYDRDTRVTLDIEVLRYIRTFEIGGMLGGVQLVQPFVSFIGRQSDGLPPGRPGGPPGRLTLTSSGGFIQPSFGAFIFPVAEAARGIYLVTGFWISPPIGHYDATANLSLTENLWTGEIEAGTHLTLLGSPAARNLALEVWGEGYFYGSSDDTPFGGPPGAPPARLAEQPSGELRIYLPYVFYPRSFATITPGFYQSFGGKQVYMLPNGVKLDNGRRTQETQLRLTLSSYLSRHWQLMLNGQWDVAAHGGLLERAVELRIGAVF